MYDTESYNAERRSLVFDHVRTLTLQSDPEIEGFDMMVGCKRARRLFVSESTGMTTIIRRIDPMSGRIDLSWTVDGDCVLASASDDHLLVVATNEEEDELLKFDTEGRCVQRVAIDPECNLRELRSLLLPNGMYHRSNFLHIHRLVRNFLPATERSMRQALKLNQDTEICGWIRCLQMNQ